MTEEIVKSVYILDYQMRQKMPADNTPLRLQAMQWTQFRKNIPSTKKKKKNPQRRCKVCAKNKKRSESESINNVLLHYTFHIVLKYIIPYYFVLFRIIPYYFRII